MAAAEARDKRPNLLLVMVDQWPGRLLGAAGHPVIQTPTIDGRTTIRSTGYPTRGRPAEVVGAPKVVSAGFC